MEIREGWMDGCGEGNKEGRRGRLLRRADSREYMYEKSAKQEGQKETAREDG